jgi:hypothetical protein
MVGLFVNDVERLLREALLDNLHLLQRSSDRDHNQGHLDEAGITAI